MRPTLPKEWENDPLLKHFLRHVVPIYFDLRRGSDKPIHLVYTAFMFSIYDQWMLMTAGHGITEIAQLRKAGYTLANCTLLDSLGTDAKYFHPVPFDYDHADPQVPANAVGWDYGIMFPTNNHRALLEANGVVPLTEQWSEENPEPEAREYKLLGIPAQMTLETAPNRSTLVPIFVRLERIAERPEGFCETTAPMFYGRLPQTLPLTEIAGMSGGPIFAIGNIDGRTPYWLHAMQVSWLRGTLLVSAMLMGPFCQFLREVMEGQHAPSSRGAQPEG
jgi:hypothetical protein